MKSRGNDSFFRLCYVCYAYKADYSAPLKINDILRGCDRRTTRNFMREVLREGVWCYFVGFSEDYDQ